MEAATEVVCEHWVNRGKCKFGDSCRRSHDAEPLTRTLESVHDHPLGPDDSSKRKKFFCEECGRKRGRVAYRCVEGCDFDLCTDCFKSLSLAEEKSKQGNGVSASMEVITEEMLEPSYGQMKRSFRDKDRMRLLNQMIEHWRFKCDQAKKIVDLFQEGKARIEAAVKIHSSLVDPENFDATVLALFQFDDEIAKVKEGISSK